MSFRLSVYEILAYTTPGALSIALIVYTFVCFGEVQIDFEAINSLSWIPLFFLAVSSYAFGIILDRFARLWQYRLFRKHESPQQTFRLFREAHSNVELRFQANDWPILLAFLRLHYPNWVAESIEYHNAANIMLRSISLLSALFALLQIGLLFKNERLVHFIMALVAFVASILLGKESVRRKRWFYFTLYEAIAASNISSANMTRLDFEKKPSSKENT